MDDQLRARLEGQARATYFDEVRRFYQKLGQRFPASLEGRHVPSYDGGETPNGRFCQPVWPRLVDFALKHGVSPTTLIKACFAGWLGLQRPEPHRLFGEWGLALVEGWKDKVLKEVQFELSYCDRRARLFHVQLQLSGEEDEIQAWRKVIYDTESNLSPLYRYCMAAKAGFDDLASRYESLAFDAYVWSSDVYDDVWGDWIPQDFRTKAAALRAKLAR